MAQGQYPQPMTKEQRHYVFHDKKKLSLITNWYFDNWHTSLGWIRACIADHALFSLSWADHRPPSHLDQFLGIGSEGIYSPEQLAPYRRHIVERMDTDIHIAMYGTPFQCQVWRALLDLDAPGTMSYSELARVIGRNKAQRAVGSAVGANPVFF